MLISGVFVNPVPILGAVVIRIGSASRWDEREEYWLSQG